MDDVPANEIVELAAFFALRERDRHDDEAERSLNAMAAQGTQTEGALPGPPVIGRPKPT